MSRKLFYLNAALMLGIIVAAAALYGRWTDARQREEMMRLGRLAALRWNPTAPIPPTKPVSALEYSLISAQMLFSRDRNPNIIIELPPPPPEKKAPALPKAYGLMLIGSKPRIILGTGVGNQKSYTAGEKVGPWEIVSFDNQTITLAWEDKTVEKRIEELVDNNPMGSTQPPGPPPGGYGGPPAGATPSGPAAAQSGLTAIGGTAGDAAKMGADTGASGTKSCAPGDNSPAGTVLNGMKKVMVQGMFGPSCYWEPAK
jgi:hypothetical protein